MVLHLGTVRVKDSPYGLSRDIPKPQGLAPKFESYDVGLLLVDTQVYSSFLQSTILGGDSITRNFP